MNEIGVLYLLELDKPLAGRAKYYLGFSSNMMCLERRLEHHRKGTGARFLAAAVEAGIDFKLIGTIPGTRNDERRYKCWHKHSQLVKKFASGQVK